jgi:beta-glucanase (GH16 family)
MAMGFDSLLLGMALIIGGSRSPQPPTAARGYRLAFYDDFRSIDLSADGTGSHVWYEGVWYSQKHAPLSNIQSTASGLTLTWTRGQQQPDTSIATFSTLGAMAHRWRYGYFEVRMKWNPEPGAWPAIWLLPSSPRDFTDMGELDIFETLHHWRRDPADPNRMIHVQNSGSPTGFDLPPGADMRQFHTYGMLWEPDRVTWFFDGKPLHSEASYAVFNTQEFSLIIGMQAGVNWALGILDGMIADRMTMTVDWVRVWQK